MANDCGGDYLSPRVQGRKEPGERFSGPIEAEVWRQKEFGVLEEKETSVAGME